MRAAIFIFCFLIFYPSINAQEIWKDYIIGRPMQDYVEAKQTVAKEWGIQYEAIFAGCVMSSKATAQAQKHSKNNKAYFSILATKFGENWMEEFNLDVKKKINLQKAEEETRILCEVITNPQNNAIYKTKKEVAQKWGIKYEPRFIKGSISEEYKASLQRDMLASNDYERHLEMVFGKDWKTTFEQEVQVALTQKEASIKPVSDKNVWIDYVIEKPNIRFFDAKKAVAKEWGINYKVKFMDCKHTPTLEQEQAKIHQQNNLYFNQLKKEHGKNWKVLFDKAVQKKIKTTNNY